MTALKANLAKCSSCNKLRTVNSSELHLMFTIKSLHNKVQTREDYYLCRSCLSDRYKGVRKCCLCLNSQTLKTLNFSSFIYANQREKYSAFTIVNNLKQWIETHRVIAKSVKPLFKKGIDTITARTGKSISLYNAVSAEHCIVLCCKNCAEELCHNVGVRLDDQSSNYDGAWKFTVAFQLNEDNSSRLLESIDVRYFCGSGDIPYDSLNERNKYIYWQKIAAKLNGPTLSSATGEARTFKTFSHYDPL